MIDFLIANMLSTPDGQQSSTLQFPPKLLSPLHVACAVGNVVAVEKLLRVCDALKDQRDTDGELPIQHAAKYAHLAVIDTFVKCRATMADWNPLCDADVETGNLLLHFAIQCVACDHSMNGDDNDTTSMATTVASRAIALVEKLIHAGSSVKAFNKSGLQPLHIAAACPPHRQHAVLAVVEALVNTHHTPVSTLSKA
jgi:ankyrin repeat protein